MSLTEHLTRAWLARGALAWALLPLSLLYGVALFTHRALFRLGLLRTRRLPVPVVVVGNRVAGGAGKTPTTLALIEHLRGRGYHPGVVSRGHGRQARSGGPDICIAGPGSTAADLGDEPLLIHWRAGVPVAVGTDRHAAALALLRSDPRIDLIVADDGLQHWRLGRDVEIVVFDERGAGNGWLLPAGPLREPVASPARAPHQIVLYSGGAASTALPGYVAERRLGPIVPLQDWRRGAASGSSAALDARGGPGCYAAAGIAVPQRFFDQLARRGLQFTPLPLPDHHAYTQQPWPADARNVVVTEKDAVKLVGAGGGPDGPALWVARLDLLPDAGFFAALDAALAARPPTRTS